MKLLRAALRSTGLFAAVLPFALPATAHASAASTSQCEATVLGYLWGDGHTRDDGSSYFFRSRSVVMAGQFDACARLIGAHVVSSRRGPFYRFSVSHLPVDVDLDGLPSAIDGASLPAVQAWLAAVIECEGTPAGQVLDDPLAARGTAIRSALSQADVGTSETGVHYIRVWADRSDWKRLQTFPFVVWSRVPGM